MNNSTPSAVQQDQVDHILHITYTFLIAVIFRGSCVPLYSSPRTMGIINPDLTLLICGWWFAWEMSNFDMSVTRNACISMTLRYPKPGFNISRGSE